MIVKASTHWVVTEDGRIQAQIDSVFNLKRPYDLVALLKQEERAETLENLRKELLSKKSDIDRNDDQDTGLEQRFYHTDPDCIAAGKPLVEFDLYMSTILPLENKGISLDELYVADDSSQYRQPYCEDFIGLDFSMHAFEHLEGVRERKNLSIAPELGLKTVVSFADDIDAYGHLVYGSLLKNSTSWVFYNMAAFYWRIKGDAFQAIECLRRALHFSPRHNKDVALVSLSNVLHQARYSNEAAIVIHAAIDVSRELNVNHFTLGNIYAVLAEYNKSVICFENTLLIQPDFEAASLRRYAVLCHAKLEAMLESQHLSLKRTLSELRDYQSKHDNWKQQQTKLSADQVSLGEKIDQRLSYETYKMRLANMGVGELCDLEEKDGRHVLQCAWARVKRVLTEYDFLPVSSSEQIAAASSEKSDAAVTVNYMHPVRSPLYSVKNDYPESDLPPYMAADWPTKEECDQHAKKFPMWNEFPTTYLSPENKGFDIHPLLSTAQGLQPGQQHPFPWYPPVCTSLSDIPEGRRSGDHVASVKERAKLPSKLSDAKMKRVLLASVKSFEDRSKSDKEDAEMSDEEEVLGESVTTQDEIGQRILTALKKNIGPRWVLYNLAALYWRIIGNTVNGLECARRALYFVPDMYRDVPLLNLANILYRVGRVDDAILLMNEALSINDFEPESHFFVANLLAAISNITGSVYHYRQALLQNPLHTEAYASIRIVSCYQKFHRTAQSMAPRETAPTNAPADVGSSCGSRPVFSETVFVCTKNGNVESCFLTSRQDDCGNQLPVPPLPSCAKQLMPALNVQCLSGSSQRANCNRGSVISSDTLVLGDNSRGGATMDDYSDYYQQSGLCSGDDCDILEAQTNMALSCNCRHPEYSGIAYERLAVIGGKMIRQVYVSGEIGEIQPTECIIFADGRRTEACSGEEFSAYIVMAKSDNQLDDNEIVNFHSDSILDFYFSIRDEHFIDNNSPERKHLLTVIEAGPRQPIKDLEENTIPLITDPVERISKRATVERQSSLACHDLLQQINLKHVPTSWIALSTKRIGFEGHLDFSVPNGELSNLSPTCHLSLIGDRLAIPYLSDNWDNMMTAVSAHYKAETGLEQLLRDFGGLASRVKDEAAATLAIEKLGARISLALKKNSTSWVINNLASLYWRVQGHGVHAVECAVIAYHHSPKKVVDVALLDIANIFHQSGLINDALTVTSLALEAVPDVVALHFMMANLYAAKGLLKRAAVFYESSIGLQKSFNPAVVRLAVILCRLNDVITGLPTENRTISDSNPALSEGTSP